MGAAKNRTLFLGTADGLYQAEPDGEGYRLSCIGFKGQSKASGFPSYSIRTIRKPYTQARPGRGCNEARTAGEPGGRSTTASSTRTFGQLFSIRRRER